MIPEPNKKKAEPTFKIDSHRPRPTKRGVSIPPEIENKKRAYSESISPKYRNQYVQTIKRACPASKAIKAMCQHCVGYEEVVDRVKHCTAWRCPLHAYRPYQDKARA